MVRASTWLVNATPLNPFQKYLLVDLKLEDSIDSHSLVLKQTVEHLGLLESSWESIKKNTFETLI